MAKKAAKSLSTRNASRLNNTHLISLTLNALFFVLHFTLNRPARLLPYMLFNTPAIVIEISLERLGRPSLHRDGSLRRAGEDLDAKGLTEYMWDILYWTWGCIGLACLLGDWAWWLYAVVPLYSAWLAWTTLGGIRNGLGGMQGDDMEDSKRQKKMEKRGGQRVVYK
ncbi:MAG: hypothetical protein Q9160_002776 [Pyrenula sp. 1 TL-2023]